jgi:hypothetical protein
VVPGGLSILWLIIPTAVFVLLHYVLTKQRDILPLVLALAGAGALYWWRRQPLPPTASPTLHRLKPFTYALQIGVVFVILGGGIAAVALAVVAGLVWFVAHNPQRVVTMLEPWWRTQEKLSPTARKVLAFAVPGAIGWYIGTNAAGVEWGATLISLSIGVAIGFLFVFTPPASMRQTTG